MAKVIGVQFQKNGKVYYFDPDTFAPKCGEYVIVDTERGPDLAEVVLDSFAYEPAENDPPLKRMIRVATEGDIQVATENRNKEREAFQICQRKIQEHQLEMKLVSVEYAFDGSKVLFYFTANGRVDFRSLVKDLASVFKTRIELRQIGVRDEARMLGGLGPCGRPICCKAFLNDFQPVSIKMAKEQNLSLNPTKISGVCGRLMCCLKYEEDQYEAVRKKMPRMGREIATPDGPGTVTDLNVVKETVSVRITNGDSSEIRTYPLEDIIAAREAEGRNGEPARKRAEAAEIREGAGKLSRRQEAAEEKDEEFTGTQAAAPETQPQEAPVTQPQEAPEAPREKEPARKRPAAKRQWESEVTRKLAEVQLEDERAEREKETLKTETEPNSAWPKPNRTRPAQRGSSERGTQQGERKLGQPVKRENPNRKPKPEGTVETAAKKEKPQAVKAEEGTANKEKPRSKWADQLQKAMAAIEHESEAGGNGGKS